MGCWCTDNYFITGTVELDFNSFDASIWLCSPPAFKSENEPYHIKLKRLLEAGRSNIECDNIQHLSSEDKAVANHNAVLELEFDRSAKSPHENVVVSWYKKQLLKFRNLQVRNF